MAAGHISEEPAGNCAEVISAEIKKKKEQNELAISL